MKRSRRVGMAMVLVLGLAWVSWVSYVNTRTTRLRVQVASTVDEVQIFTSRDPERPQAVVTTNSQDTVALIELPNAAGNPLLYQARPALYYFVTRRGDQRYRSPIICCEIGVEDHNEGLMIHNLDTWDQHSR